MGAAQLYAWFRRVVTVLAVLAAAALSVTVAPSPAQAATPSWPVVKKGSKGADVQVVQYLLRHHGSTALGATGTFDNSTEAEVKEFQSTHALGADGIVGANTWAKLVVTLDTGATGEAVKALQSALNKYGYDLSVDGSYGSNTAAAVTDFKTTNALSGGTTVGTTTWQWLLGSSAGTGSGAYRFVHAKTSIKSEAWLTKPHHDYPAADIPVFTGEPTYAATAGTVSHLDGGCGYGVLITGDDGVSYKYCHFSERLVAEGTHVTAGQLIGKVGATGSARGPHLHLEMHYPYGTLRCPQDFLLALYRDQSPPDPKTLPTTGCTY